jgi:formate dehydrogenase major subunit
VVVVGGGNTAIDCARSALRLGPRNVKILYRRTRREMPCLMQEVEDAEAEGLVCEFLQAPTRLERNGSHRLLLTCQRMTLGAPDASGRRSPMPVEGSEHVIDCSTVIAAIGQTVDRSVAEIEGLRVTGWGIAADERTLATNLPGVFAGGDSVLGADLAVRAVAAGRIAAASIDQFLRGEAVVGEARSAAVVFRPVDDTERALIFRGIETAKRVPLPEIAMERRLEDFDEVAVGLSDTDAVREASRCLTCGCRKSDGCRVRMLATEYGADPARFAGARRRFSQDTSHPDIIYEPGKCILCDACVRIAAAGGEALGLTAIGRGFDVAVTAPFNQPLSEALRKTAMLCAEACPTGALALRSARACDLGSCSGNPQSPPYCRIQ